MAWLFYIKIRMQDKICHYGDILNIEYIQISWSKKYPSKIFKFLQRHQFIEIINYFPTADWALYLKIKYNISSVFLQYFYNLPEKFSHSRRLHSAVLSFQALPESWTVLSLSNLGGHYLEPGAHLYQIAWCPGKKNEHNPMLRNQSTTAFSDFQFIPLASWSWKNWKRHNSISS